MINRILKGILRRLSPIFGDKTYLRLKFRLEMGRKLDFDNCRTMDEKLQWLKIYNRYARLTDIVDKIKVKQIIASLIGEEYIIPTLKVWNSPDYITAKEIAGLPSSFVIKTNHSGGNTGVYICKDKDSIDLNFVREKMSRSLESDIYRDYREWPYKNVEKKIFAEKYLGEDLVDYKFYCFNSDVDCVMLCVGRQGKEKTKFYFFDKNWKLCRYNKAGKEAPEDFTLPKPDGMDKMFELASELSKGFPFVRVDLYNVNGKIYFGELTFFPASGFEPNRLPETDLYFGNKIDLTLARKEI